MFRLFKEIRVKILIGYLLLIVIAFFSVFFLFDKFSRLSLPDEEEGAMRSKRSLLVRHWHYYMSRRVTCKH